MVTLHEIEQDYMWQRLTFVGKRTSESQSNQPTLLGLQARLRNHLQSQEIYSKRGDRNGEV